MMITNAQNTTLQSTPALKVELGKPGEAEKALKELRTLGGKIKSEQE